MFKTLKRPLIMILATASLSACGAWDNIKNIGKAPPLAPIEDVKVAEKVQSLGMRKPLSHTGGSPKTQANSLWRTGARAFFNDQRASDIGDIVTVKINITDQASVDNTTTRSRSSAEGLSMPNMLGLESKVANVLPGVDTSSAVDIGSTTSTSGAGSVDRSETINMTVAALVSKVLPNGNLVIQGRQEVRVNFEVRELLITGIIRPEDISSGNTVLHTQIAEARISYGGRGQLTQLQQARWGQQLYEILFPF